MWFNKSERNEEVTPRPSRARKGDMRSELGLGNDYTQNNTSPSPKTRRLGALKAVTQEDTSHTYNEDVLLNDLKVRARRRLIGALVLLATAFIILPWVFDGNHKQAAPVVTISVPEQKIQFDVQNPRVTSATEPTTAPVAVAEEKPVKPVEAIKPKVEEKPVVPPEPVKTNKYVVHIGIVSSKTELDALNARLTAKGVKASNEAIKTKDGNTKTRVRLGPFDSQASAQAAADKIKGAVKNPVVIELK